LARPRQVLGVLSTVLFAPEDLAMVKGDPGERRRFLDDLLVALTPRMAGVRADYDRVLKQRNALLKTAGATIRAGRGDLRTLDTWDAHLAGVGADVLAARLKLVTELRPVVNKTYDEICGGGGEVNLEYRSSLGADAVLVADRDVLEQAMLTALAQHRTNDLERGVSLIGPHRDDLLLTLGQLPARGYASHGESWSLALALRLAAYEALRVALGTDPVLILDDVFAELDCDRRSRLANLVAGAQQVLVTAAVPGDVPAELRGARYDVSDGRVERVS
jgi:DNA replication and repair protein RecF